MEKTAGLKIKESYSSHCDYDFEVGDELSDLQLLVEDRCLFVHKAILGMQKPVE